MVVQITGHDVGADFLVIVSFTIRQKTSAHDVVKSSRLCLAIFGGVARGEVRVREDEFSVRMFDRSPRDDAPAKIGARTSVAQFGISVVSDRPAGHDGQALGEPGQQARVSVVFEGPDAVEAESSRQVTCLMSTNLLKSDHVGVETRQGRG